MSATHPVAKSIILDSDGKFLLLIRSETHPALAGYADLPGGMIEDGEDAGAAVCREIYEETQLRVNEPKILYATTMMINGQSYPTVLFLARLSDKSPDIVLSWEHKSFEWAPLDKLVEIEPQLAPTYREALAYICNNAIIEDA